MLLAPPQIMIVDDEALLARMMSRYLSHHGLGTKVYLDATEAWDELQLNHSNYALLISDLTMPGMSGAELVRNALAISPGLPIILCSGFSEELDEQAAMDMGVRYFLSKPVLPKKLLDLIRNLLNLNAEDPDSL